MHTTDTPHAIESRKHALHHQLGGLRGRTFGMVHPLSYQDLHGQHSSLMSPIVWDMGHIANFEEYWLLRELDGRAAHDPQLDELYNPFDNPRWSRGDLPILDRDAATTYLNEVRGDTVSLLDRSDFRSDNPLERDGYVFDMVVQHEAQHQETVLQALDLRTDIEPYEPARSPARPPGARTVVDTQRVTIPAGRFRMGTDDRLAAYDNERPSHTVDVGAFAIDRFPVTSRRYAEFVAAGGYDEPRHWTHEGWKWRTETGHDAPQGWIPDLEGGWLVRRFGHIVALDPAEPVQHVSFHEAQAFATWSGGRLPTEAEWEKAALWDPASDRSRVYPWGDRVPGSDVANLDHRAWGPVAVGSYPRGASPLGVEQMIGDVYEWTTSWFQGYPGYATFPYPEYSEVFFGEEYRVLRGASWATAREVARGTFRNWDWPIRRQIFAGFRLAWDLS